MLAQPSAAMLCSRTLDQTSAATVSLPKLPQPPPNQPQMLNPTLLPSKIWQTRAATISSLRLPSVRFQSVFSRKSLTPPGCTDVSNAKGLDYDPRLVTTASQVGQLHVAARGANTSRPGAPQVQSVVDNADRTAKGSQTCLAFCAAAAPRRHRCRRLALAAGRGHLSRHKGARRNRSMVYKQRACAQPAPLFACPAALAALYSSRGRGRRM